MAEDRNATAEIRFKVAIVGAPGSGRAAMVNAMANQYASSPVRMSEIGGGRVVRSEFRLPAVGAESRALHVHLIGVSAEPDYDAVTDLVVEGADAILLAVSLAHERAMQARLALQKLLTSAQHNGIVLESIPVALTYAISTSSPQLTPEEMDRGLGISPAALPRFVIAPGSEEVLRAPVEWIIARAIQAADDAGDPPAAQPGDQSAASGR